MGYERIYVYTPQNEHQAYAAVRRLVRTLFPANVSICHNTRLLQDELQQNPVSVTVIDASFIGNGRPLAERLPAELHPLIRQATSLDEAITGIARLIGLTA